MSDLDKSQQQISRTCQQAYFWTRSDIAHKQSTEMQNVSVVRLLVLCTLLAAAHGAKLDVDASKVVQQVGTAHATCSATPQLPLPVLN